MSKSVLLTSLLGIAFILIVTGVIIFFARGYTFNPRSGQIQKTGIMVVTSEPSSAAVYLNDELKATTNTTINFLAPGTYSVKVTKEGFTPWVKNVEVKPELVTRLDVVLFPQVPDLRRLTFMGVQTAFATPDGSHAVYYVTDATNKGLWVMNLADTLPFVNSDPMQIYKDTGAIDLSKAQYLVAPDGKSMLVIDTTQAQPVYYMLDLTRVNDTLTPTTETDLLPILTAWHDTYYSKVANAKQRLVNSVRDIPKYDNPNPNISPIVDAVSTVLDQTALPAPSSSGAASATPSPTPAEKKALRTSPSPSPVPDAITTLIANIQTLAQVQQQWSPDQNRVLYQSGGKMLSYDLGTGETYSIPKAAVTFWLPTSEHIVLVNPQGKTGEVAVTDYDGQNEVVLFSGQLSGTIAMPWNDGSRIVILTNLNQAADTAPNLYSINLR